jgi:hypothetical protein
MQASPNGLRSVRYAPIVMLTTTRPANCLNRVTDDQNVGQNQQFDCYGNRHQQTSPTGQRRISSAMAAGW